MTRVHLRSARPAFHLARAVTAADGQVVAGIGTALTPSVVRSLAAAGVDSLWIEEDALVAEWEEDPDLERALAALDARFAGAPADAILGALKTCLHDRLVARAQRDEEGRE
jgi:hypothetical protein